MGAWTMASDGKPCPRRERILAWAVHLLTASGVVWGLWALQAIQQREWLQAFWWMGTALLVDGVDGTLARRARVWERVPQVDGTLLDNIIDYLNYVVVPCFFLLQSDLLPERGRVLLVGLPALASAYQFCQVDAKTPDHYFKGFPSYWNVVAFYLFLWGLPAPVNALILVGLALLVFVPIKYLYPSRMEHLSRRAWVRPALLGLTLAWLLVSGWQLWQYPTIHAWAMGFLMGYAGLYMALSLYRTLVPLEGAG